ncbi:hypothetical protein L2E82_21050 [Cichorium intybus]|uniref:Uncharacterized protein n=1 Tax=Cichorium intybus TaxID=13427 RepID=A0ACB9DVH3_CICIN|nr:hypothetical protein L2E82_21050 [Cichorium intybus]
MKKTLLLLFCCLMKFSSSKNSLQDHLRRGSSLSVGDDSHLITSPDKTFTCGFYGFQTNAYWFAIWFTNSKDRTVVWTANRNKPVNGHGSKLTLQTNGAMVLTDVDGMFVWGTNTTSTDVNRAVLLNTEISSVYWPSPDVGFDVFRYGRTSFNSSRYADFNDLGVFKSSDGWQFSASDMGLGVRRRLTMDYDGNLRFYSLNESTGLWSISWQAIAQPCDVHGICGRNGICVYGDKPPACSCPAGHEWRNITDLSRGCKPTFNRTRGNSTKFRFLPTLHTDYYGFDLNYSRNISFESCRDICLGDSRCEAFSYRLTGEGLCFAKSSLFNGYQEPNFPGTIYFKVPIGMETPESSSILIGSKTTCADVLVMLGSPSMYKSSGGKVKWVYLYSFALAIGLVEALVILLGWWIFYGNNPVLNNIEEGYRMISNQFRGFSYKELMRATQNFKVEIGRGGSGVVYKGVLEDERVVAVKRLGDVSEGGEFWTEVSTIGKINHMNLVRMWGFCSERKHKLLVYEYVENLSLDKRLFSSTFLQWKERFKVAIGIAKGLAYLHHECLEWVIHCDVKPENILLDGSFEAKIADFGLAKLSQRGGQNSEVTRIRGTKGYMAPEWASNLPITAKVDVYSYGVVVLEMAKGIRLSNIVMQEGEGEEEESELTRLLRVAKMKSQEEEKGWIEEIIDPRLGGVFSRKQAVTLVEMGLSCVEEDRHKRPTMDSVVQVLIDCEPE